MLILEEYRSQFKIADILNYLDGYPLLLPCRYFNRQACFTKVFLITNVPLEDQYRTVSEESRNAFLAVSTRWSSTARMARWNMIPSPPIWPGTVGQTRRT